MARTTLEEVKVAAEVSGSQMYHYFPDKNELVQAVIDYQADNIVKRNANALSGPNDPEARALVAAGFDRWAAAISDGLRSLDADGKLPPAIDPDDLATTLLATLQGGLLLGQVQRSPRPVETAVNTLLALMIDR